ncbi:MAG: hypothetical protein GWO20_07420, partial [Candidatus Korarchaeota archaeon]|nr:hypothetical protein [Candidatus Korarchaeota archaeon]NIU82770.1 hypothetical protein [Candidatus Thorarchaeota archaeon]NIW13269.1 hypothetical protein [Candidatus Thorarchaeota archaeon]NIW51717.1 hypothetical protein [Candidatus Korarchaeota archaeon]
GFTPPEEASGAIKANYETTKTNATETLLQEVSRLAKKTTVSNTNTLKELTAEEKKQADLDKILKEFRGEGRVSERDRSLTNATNDIAKAKNRIKLVRIYKAADLV